MAHARKIVIGVDHEDLGDAALRAGFALASAAGDTELHAVHVRSSFEGFPVTAGTVARIDGDLDKLRLRASSVLTSWHELHPEAQITQLTAHVVNGRPATALVRTAAGLQAGLIVVGTHGRRGIKRAIVGSVAGEVVAKASCPVLVVRSIEHDTSETLADVEPLCVECSARRVATEGAALWCDRHAEHHPRAHVYSYAGRSSAPVRPWGF